MPELTQVLQNVSGWLTGNDFKVVGYETLSGGSSETQVAFNNVEVTLSPLNLTGYQRRNDLAFDLVCQLVPSPIKGLEHEKRAAVIARQLTIAIMELKRQPAIKDSYITGQAYSAQDRLLTVSCMVVFYDDPS